MWLVLSHLHLPKKELIFIINHEGTGNQITVENNNNPIRQLTLMTPVFFLNMIQAAVDSKGNIYAVKMMLVRFSKSILQMLYQFLPDLIQIVDFKF